MLMKHFGYCLIEKLFPQVNSNAGVTYVHALLKRLEVTRHIPVIELYKSPFLLLQPACTYDTLSLDHGGHDVFL